MNQTERLDLQSKFIELRGIKHHSLSSIEADIGVSKKTLIKWSKEMELELDSFRDAHREALAEKYGFTVTKKQELFGQLKLKLEKELMERDLSDIPTEKLIKSFIAVMEELKPPTEIRTGEVDYETMQLGKPEKVAIG